LRWTAALSSWTTSKSEPENDVRLRLRIGVAEVGPTSRLRSSRGPRCSSSRFAIGLASARCPETGGTAGPLGKTTSSEPRTTARSCSASGSGRERAGRTPRPGQAQPSSPAWAAPPFRRRSDRAVRAVPSVEATVRDRSVVRAVRVWAGSSSRCATRRESGCRSLLQYPRACREGIGLGRVAAYGRLGGSQGRSLSTLR